MKNFYKKVPRTSRWRYFSSMLLMVLTASLGNVKAQVSAYTFSQSNGAFSSIAATGTVVAGSEATTSTTNDTSGWTVTIPFDFNFNGNNYNSVYVNSNGGATFGAVTNTGSSLISATTAYDGAISVMNRDLWGAFITSGVTTNGSNVITNVVSMQGIEVGKALNAVNGIPTGATVTAFDATAGTITMSAPATSSSSAAVVRYGSGIVYTATEGTAPNRVFVIEWKGYNDYGSAASDSNHLNFQLRLAETSNIVSAVYGPSYIFSTGSKTNQIGLRGFANSDYNNRAGTVSNPWNATNAGTSNSATVARNNTNFPASGLTFNWTPPICIAPGIVTFGIPSSSSVSLSWPALPAASSYTIYYSTTNTAPTAATVLDATNSVTVTAPASTGTIAGLNPSTQYYVWLRTNCTAPDQSVWSAKGSFVTACPAVTAPWTYTVESAANTTSAVIADCWFTNPGGTTTLYRWNVDGSGSTPSSDTGPASAYSGVRYFYTEASEGSTGSIAELYTPNVNVTALTNPSLQFYYHMYGATMGALHVDVFDGAAWTNDMLVLTGQQNTSLTDPWKLAIVDLGVLNITGDVKVRFRSIRGTDFYGDMAIDDISFMEAPSCFIPSALTLNSFTASTANVSWTAPANAPSAGYNVYYSTVNTAPTATTVLDATNSVTSTTLSATIPGLSANTTYYVWVASNCGTSQSTWIGPVSVFTGYCSPAPSSVDGQGITNVTFGSGTNVVNNTTAAETGNYGNYSAMVGDIPAGVASQVNITYATGYSYGTKIWIDLNNDLIFNDATELLYTGLSTSADPTTLSALITIPATTAPGTYRMRIGGTDNDAGPGSSCYTGTYGAFEDYTVNVTPPPSCLPPTGITVDAASITSTGANVNVTVSSPAPANGYTVYYSTVNTAPTSSTVLDATNSAGSTTNTVALSALTPSSTYFVWVRANCSATDLSDWVAGPSFNTLCAPVAAPYTQSFSSGSLPNCWSNVNPTSTSTNANAFWKFSGTADYGAVIANSTKPGGTFAWVDASSPYTGEHTVQLISPQIDLTGLTNPYLQFEWFKNHLDAPAGSLPSYDNNKLLVHVTTDGTTWTQIFADDTNSSVWRTVGIPLPSSYVGATVRFRFTVDKDVAGNGYFYDDLLLDEISVLQNPNLATGEVVSNTKEVKVYPNPFTDVVNISDVKDLKSLSVVDMSGRLVKTIANPGRQVNLSELKAGLYILKLDYKDGASKSVKAIKK